METYARDMRAGAWQLGPDAIVFDRNGVVINGHHRLTAVVRSGVTIRVIVLGNAPPSVLPVIDSGAPRNFADVLDFRGELNRSPVAAGVSLLWKYDMGKMQHSDHPSRTEQDATLRRHPAVRWAASEVISFPQGVKASAGTFMLTLGYEADPRVAEEVAMMLRTGTGFGSPGHPILHLRERMLEQRASKMKRSRVEMCALAIKAWNFYKLGRDEIRILKWMTTEPFPALLGHPSTDQGDHAIDA